MKTIKSEIESILNQCLEKHGEFYGGDCYLSGVHNTRALPEDLYAAIIARNALKRINKLIYQLKDELNETNRH